MTNTVHSLTEKELVGKVVEFRGYSEAGIEAIFQPGQHIRIEKYNPMDGGMTASAVDGEQSDTVFLDEVIPPVAEVDEPADTQEVETPVAAKKPRKSKAVAKPKKVVAAKAAKTAAPKAKAKARAKNPTVEITEFKVRLEDSEPDMLDVLAGNEFIPSDGELVAEPPVTTVTAVSDKGVSTAVMDSQRVSAILHEQDALDAAKALVAQAEETYFTLGGVLAHIYYEGIYKTVGYDGKRGFADYIDRELGIHYRKAMYLIDIYVKFRAIGIDEHRLTQIGWSKAKEIKDYATPDNFDELLELAQTKSRTELIEHMQRTFVADGTGTPGRLSKLKLHFSLFADQAETVTRALDAAKERAGNDDVNQALEFICAEWLSITDGIDVSLEDATRHLELKYGVRLVPQSTVDSEGLLAPASTEQ